MRRCTLVTLLGGVAAAWYGAGVAAGETSERDFYRRFGGEFDAGILKQPVPYDQVIDMRFVNEVKKELSLR